MCIRDRQPGGSASGGARCPRVGRGGAPRSSMPRRPCARPRRARRSPPSWPWPERKAFSSAA
eukprot:9068102-Pyramimonas_sp.AAC.1